jgi:hypothetical protein
MMGLFRAGLLGLFIVAINTSLASAHMIFKNELQTQYDFRIVSCFTCHAKKSEVKPDQQDAYTKNAKAFRNEFGNEFATLLKDKNLSAKIKAATESGDAAAKSAAEEEALAAFKEALKKVIEIKSPRGTTYGEELKTGTLSGVTKK